MGDIVAALASAWILSSDMDWRMCIVIPAVREQVFRCVCVSVCVCTWPPPGSSLQTWTGAYASLSLRYVCLFCMSVYKCIYRCVCKCLYT